MNQQKWEKLGQTEDVNEIVEIYNGILTTALHNHASWKQINVHHHPHHQKGLAEETKADETKKYSKNKRIRRIQESKKQMQQNDNKGQKERYRQQSNQKPN